MAGATELFRGSTDPWPEASAQHPSEQEPDPDCCLKRWLHSGKVPDVFPRKNASDLVVSMLSKAISECNPTDQQHSEMFCNEVNVLS